uniref:Rho-GAP domain-containing protein n=1 Tax=Vannella robusta TaxID=1487602 RepID=A0A7S4IIV3_9EUKA|mmetsp:Transcript_3148/g.3870  ORF Transcript_3148/g.3870 Transcript_3148/m.3870 type:complete len:544 (+) Transcript_3148:22-1653(+)
MSKASEKSSGKTAKRSQDKSHGSSSKKRTSGTLHRFKNSWKGSSFQEAKKERFSVCGFYRASESLPPIVEQACKYLEHNALQSEGIFRISGSQEDVRRIKDRFDKGRKTDLSKEENANTIAGVLKLFFTELNNPVLSYELYPSFMAAVEMPDPLLRVWCVRRTLATLPPGNRVVLDRVCAMFRIITRFADDNKMTAKNIALVMNPSMFRDKEGGLMGLLTTGGLRVRLVQLLIAHHEDLFVTPKEELHQRVRELEPSMTLEAQQQLDNFSNMLQEGAILLAKNLLNEGETEIKVQFDDTDTFSAPPKLPTDEDMKNMSFEEFAAHMAIHPPGGVEIPGAAAVVANQGSGRNRRTGYRFGTVTAPVKYNLNGEKRLSKCFSLGDLAPDDADESTAVSEAGCEGDNIDDDVNNQELENEDSAEETQQTPESDTVVLSDMDSTTATDCMDSSEDAPGEKLQGEKKCENKIGDSVEEVKERFKGSPKSDRERKKRAKNRKKMKGSNLTAIRSRSSTGGSDKPRNYRSLPGFSPSKTEKAKKTANDSD